MLQYHLHTVYQIAGLRTGQLGRKYDKRNFSVTQITSVRKAIAVVARLVGQVTQKACLEGNGFYTSLSPL